MAMSENIAPSGYARHAPRFRGVTLPCSALPCSDRAKRVGLRCFQLCEHRFAGNGGLSLVDQRLRPVRQVDIDARAEANHADALPGADRRTLPYERHDAARHEAGDLDDGEAHASRGHNDEGVTLVRLTGLI